MIVVANHMPADEEDKFEAARNQTLSIVCPPWAAQVAFVSTFVSAMYGFNYIAVGNERSANEGNGTVYLGAEVNHQVWITGGVPRVPFGRDCSRERRLAIH